MLVTTGARYEPPLRAWVGVAGALLLVQGALSLAIDLSGMVLPSLVQAFVGDPRHASIHVFWGAVMLALLASRGDRPTLARLSLAFGIFYLALGILGVAVNHPLGLVLGPGENAFHFLVGPVSLILGIWGTASLASSSRRE